MTSTEGLKKSEAMQKVQNYITYFYTQDMKPKAVHFDGGGEFLTNELHDWLKQEGIIAQPTAPYSPSQNGVAECLNHTLIELACAMVNAQYFYGNKLYNMQCISTIQMSITYMDLELPFGFSTKSKTGDINLKLSCCKKSLSASISVTNLSSIIIHNHKKSLP